MQVGKDYPYLETRKPETREQIAVATRDTAPVRVFAPKSAAILGVPGTVLTTEVVEGVPLELYCFTRSTAWSDTAKRRPGMRVTTYWLDVNEYAEQSDVTRRRNNRRRWS